MMIKSSPATRKPKADGEEGAHRAEDTKPMVSPCHRRYPAAENQDTLRFNKDSKLWE